MTVPIMYIEFIDKFKLKDVVESRPARWKLNA